MFIRLILYNKYKINLVNKMRGGLVDSMGRILFSWLQASQSQSAKLGQEIRQVFAEIIRRVERLTQAKRRAKRSGVGGTMRRVCRRQ